MKSGRDRMPIGTSTAAGAWRRAAPGAPAPLAIEVLRPSRKAAVYRLAGALPDGGDVIAKRCRRANAVIERLIYEDFLARARVTSPRWLGHADDEDAGFRWLFLEDAGEEEYQRDLRDHRRLAGHWLARLETAALGTGLHRHLPDRGPRRYRALLRSARTALAAHLDAPAFPEAEVRSLAALVDGLDRLEAHWDEIEALCAPLPRTLVHGDLVRKNVRVRGGDGDLALLVFDWENAGWGEPCVDLAQLAEKALNPDLAAYRAVHDGLPAAVDDAALRGAARCGAYFRLLDAITWMLPLPVHRSRRYLVGPLSALRVYRERLGAALGESGWAS